MDYDLDELERLEKAATAGPWCESAMWGILRHAKKSSGPWDDDENGVYPDEDDAKFVVATRNALPALIRDLRAMRAMAVRVLEGLERYERRKGY